MFVGVDHSTTGVKVGILDGDEKRTAFTLDRAALGEGEADLLGAIADHVPPEEIQQAAINYSWGNAISAVTPIESVDNRGIKDQVGAGYELGGGTVAFDALADSSVPAVVVPGVHWELPPLHPYFTHYSALAGGDKVAAIKYAADQVDADTFLWACASSSCMAGLVVDGTLRGFFHWMGLMHGWPDPVAVRAMDDERAQDVFMQCGILSRSGRSFDAVRDTPDRDLLEQCYWASLHNLSSLVPFARELGGEIETIALTGRLTRIEEPFDLAGRLADALAHVAPVEPVGEYSSAYGTAHIARDVARGAPDVLGIPVGGASA